MTASKFDLMTFDAQEMIQFTYEKNGCSLPTGSFVYDMRSAAVRRRLLIQGDDPTDNSMREDAPLFFQIRECQKEKTEGQVKEDEDGDCLKMSIVFLDFSEIFSPEKGRDKRYYLNNQSEDASDEKRDGILRRLFVEGFDLIFSGPNAESAHRTHFVPFDKSSSMSRQARISFIDDSLSEQLERRLCLDMDISEISGSDKFNRSKYFAYRGLYLSSGTRMDQDSRLILNEETVLVLPNVMFDADGNEINGLVPVKHQLDKATEYITVDIPDNAGETPFTVQKLTGNEVSEVTAFDGEGLICPEYSRILNRQLRSKRVRRNEEHRNDPSATSFQIRMPFIKGMLHQVEFHEFLKDEILENTGENIQGLKIVDAFGIQRELTKVRIVLTVSMFKAYFWLKDYCSLHEIGDPMQYYFAEFRKYSHALYICQTDLGYTRSYASLTYQFLNTLAMSEEQFDALIDRHMNYVRNIETIKKADYEEELENPTLSAWKHALAVNRDFAEDVFIREKLRTEQNAILRDMALGNIRTAGYQRYLSDDLLALLLHMAECIVTDTATVRGNIVKIKGSLMYDYKFFLPYGRNASADPSLKLNRREYYGFLRSPHLSRNEDCLLKAYQPVKHQEGAPYDLYARYFSHLSGIVMLSYKSEAAQVLGGADYDGDLVQIILDRGVNDAIAAGAYAEDENRPGVLKRSLRTAIIPEAKIHHIANQMEYPERPERRLRAFGTSDYYADMFETVHKTFSNHIGRISNTAFRLGRYAYHQKALSAEDRAQMEDACALCTVITGLDIDAAKTGTRPDVLSWIDESMKIGDIVVKKEKDAYLQTNRFLKSDDDLVNMSGRLDFKESESKEEIKVSWKAKEDKKEIFTAFKTQTGEGDLWTNVDRLPYYYAFGLKEIDEARHDPSGRKKTEAEPSEKRLFRFQSDATDEQNLTKIQAGQQEELRRVIGSYKKFNGIRRNLSFAQKSLRKSKYIRYVYNLLNIEYDYETDHFGVEERDFILAVSEAYYMLEELTRHEYKVRDVLHRLEEDRWAFAYGQDAQSRMLHDILDPESLFDSHSVQWKVAETLFEDPTDDGYRILLYMLRELRDEYKKERYAHPEIEEFMITDKNSSDDKINVSLFNELLRIYQDGLLQQEFTGRINRKVQKVCWNHVLKIYDGDARAAIQSAWAIRSTADSNENFFWNVIDREALKQEIYTGKEGEPEDHAG